MSRLIYAINLANTGLIPYFPSFVSPVPLIPVQNVAHVGHANREVAAAVRQQMERVNSNSRYLHPLRVQLAAQLLATLPPPLRTDGVVFFVNSGSEANDLAMRLAQAATGRSHFLVHEGAYHGHTVATISISPYKFHHRRYRAAQWPAPQNTIVVPAPASGSSKQQEDQDLAASAIYLTADVEKACAQNGSQLAAFIVESGMSVGGVVIPPPQYMQRAFEIVRGCGALCICDEVQTGLGRLGDVWWAFEALGVVPDIVTVGKPFGNGLPLAAVVARRSVSEAFARGPEYFNTFGGNPVCCAAGLAVLHEIERRGLRQHAATIGAELQQRLRALMTDPAGDIIGDVRGRGLFLGVEFVEDRKSMQPAPSAASWICTRLKVKHNVLTSLDGSHDQVMVIKPPLVFGQKEVDVFINALTECLAAWEASGRRDTQGQSVSPTPT